MLMIIGSHLLIKRISKPLADSCSYLDNLSKGDLTLKFPKQLLNRHDEIGQLFCSMEKTTVFLNNFIGNMQHSFESLLSLSLELSNNSDNLAQRTERQAAALEEIAASIEELTSTSQLSNKNTAELIKLSLKTIEQSNQGKIFIRESINAMKDIKTSGEEITNIISIISEIAFRTNLLALNAAVEAARAGEHGRGFAVVAGEVRELAQKSTVESREISGLISDSDDSISVGLVKIDDVNTQFNNILDSISESNKSINEINISSNEQLLGIEQINKAILQMDQVTQHNAALAEKNALVSKSIDNEIKNLNSYIDFFKFNI